MPDPSERTEASVSTILIIVSGVIVGATTATLILWWRDRSVVEEHQLIEWTEAAILLLTALVHGFRSALAPDRAGRVVRVSLMLLCVSIAIREIDIDLLGPPDVMERVEGALRLALVFAWLVFAGWAFRSFEDLWTARGQWVRSRLAILSALGCAGYVAARPFDKFWVDLDDDVLVLIEETLHLNATLLFFMASLAPVPRVRTLEESSNGELRTLD